MQRAVPRVLVTTLAAVAGLVVLYPDRASVALEATSRVRPRAIPPSAPPRLPSRRSWPMPIYQPPAGSLEPMPNAGPSEWRRPAPRPDSAPPPPPTRLHY